MHNQQKNMMSSTGLLARSEDETRTDAEEPLRDGKDVRFKDATDGANYLLERPQWKARSLGVFETSLKAFHSSMSSTQTNGLKASFQYATQRANRAQMTTTNAK